jgi:hypothetical protein
MSVADLIRSPWHQNPHFNQPAILNRDGVYALEGIFMGPEKKARIKALVELVNEGPRIAKALQIAEQGLYDGDHDKMWVIDQIVRALTGDDYKAFVQAQGGLWDEGIAP